MEQQYVTKHEFEGRKTVEDERFRRDKERLDEYQKAIADMTRISDQLSQIVDRHDKALDKQDGRLGALEQKPAKRWESVVGYVLSGIIVALVTFLATQAGLK